MLRQFGGGEDCENSFDAVKRLAHQPKNRLSRPAERSENSFDAVKRLAPIKFTANANSYPGENSFDAVKRLAQLDGFVNDPEEKG